MKTVKIKPIAISNYFMFKNQLNNKKKLKRNKNVDVNEMKSRIRLLMYILNINY